MPRRKFNLHEFLNPDLNADPEDILTTKNRSLKQLQIEQEEKEHDTDLWIWPFRGLEENASGTAPNWPS